MKMPDDFKIARTALAELHHHMEAIEKLANPSYVSVFQQIERTLEPIRFQQIQISRALEMTRVTDSMQEFVRANQHWQNLIKQATSANRLAESISTAHQSWLDAIKPFPNEFSHLSRLQASAKLALCDTSLRLVAAERLMAGIDFEGIRVRFPSELGVIGGLEDSVANVAASYGGLADSFREISDITRLPTFVLPGATREIYTTNFALNTFRPRDDCDEQEDEAEIQFVAEAKVETSDCFVLLQQVDPGLARPYIGARDALSGNNADRGRHILSSLRELWSHLLRRLAPDDLVTAWIPSMANQTDLLHDGKPTRRARVLYVCRDLNNDPLSEFLAQDTRSLLMLIDLFNRVHSLENGLTDEQLRAILLKTDSWLMYILQLSLGDFHK